MKTLEYLVQEMETSLTNIKGYMKKGEREFAASTLSSFADEVNMYGGDDLTEMMDEEY